MQRIPGERKILECSLMERTVGSQMMWAGQWVQMEEGGSLGADGGGQVTGCRWRRAGHWVQMEEGRSLGADGGRPTSKESRSNETARLLEKGQNS